MKWETEHLKILKLPDLWDPVGQGWTVRGCITEGPLLSLQSLFLLESSESPDLFTLARSGRVLYSNC